MVVFVFFGGGGFSFKSKDDLSQIISIMKEYLKLHGCVERNDYYAIGRVNGNINLLGKKTTTDNDIK